VAAAVRDFEAFYEATWPRLFPAVVLVATSRSDAEDALQDAYVRAARNWESVQQMDNPEGWVRRVAFNRSLPAAERQVVVLHHLLDLPVEKVAHELGRPSGTVEAQLVRGRRALAVRLRVDVDAEVRPGPSPAPTGTTRCATCSGTPPRRAASVPARPEPPSSPRAGAVDGRR